MKLFSSDYHPFIFQSSIEIPLHQSMCAKVTGEFFRPEINVKSLSEINNSSNFSAFFVAKASSGHLLQYLANWAKKLLLEKSWALHNGGGGVRLAAEANKVEGAHSCERAGFFVHDATLGLP